MGETVDPAALAHCRWYHHRRLAHVSFPELSQGEYE